MTLTDARTWVRQFVADATDSTMYSNENVDRAIITAGEYFCRQTRAVKSHGNVTLTVSSESVSLTTPNNNGFRPERIISAYIPGYSDSLTVIDYEQYNALTVTDPELEGVPEAIAFLDATTASVFPVPDIAYALKLRWWNAFTTFTPGTESPGAVVLNIAEDYLPAVLSDGAAAVLEIPNADKRKASLRWQNFLAYVDGMRGAGNLGTKVVLRNKLE